MSQTRYYIVGYILVTTAHSYSNTNASRMASAHHSQEQSDETAKLTQRNVARNKSAIEVIVEDQRPAVKCGHSYEVLTVLRHHDKSWISQIDDDDSCDSRWDACAQECPTGDRGKRHIANAS